jgi:hypothetical protein
MSGNISLTTEDMFYGTQMKPDIYEPATAEWAGRTAMNTGWLFERQQQVIFGDGNDRTLIFETPVVGFDQVFRRRFWLNEVAGTFYLLFHVDISATDLVLAGTIRQGYGWGWTTVGTGVGTWTTSGWKSLTIYTDPDWHKDAPGHELERYGELNLRGIVTPSGGDVRFRWFALSALPRS